MLGCGWIELYVLKEGGADLRCQCAGVVGGRGRGTCRY